MSTEKMFKVSYMIWLQLFIVIILANIGAGIILHLIGA